VIPVKLGTSGTGATKGINPLFVGLPGRDKTFRRSAGAVGGDQLAGFVSTRTRSA
jgi:hypothetical protein